MSQQNLETGDWRCRTRAAPGWGQFSTHDIASQGAFFFSDLKLAFAALERIPLELESVLDFVEWVVIKVPQGGGIGGIALGRAPTEVGNSVNLGELRQCPWIVQWGNLEGLASRRLGICGAVGPILIELEPDGLSVRWGFPFVLEQCQWWAVWAV